MNRKVIITLLTVFICFSGKSVATETNVAIEQFFIETRNKLDEPSSGNILHPLLGLFIDYMQQKPIDASAPTPGAEFNYLTTKDNYNWTATVPKNFSVNQPWLEIPEVVIYKGLDNYPSKELIQSMCAVARAHFPDKTGNTFWAFEAYLLREAKTSPSDPKKIEKVQKWWDENYIHFVCPKNTLAYPKGGLLKGMVNAMFDEMLMTLAFDYKVNLNIKDPVDNETILDYIKKEMQYDIWSNSDIRDFQMMYNILRAGGAKHSHEIFTTTTINEAITVSAYGEFYDEVEYCSFHIQQSAFDEFYFENYYLYITKEFEFPQYSHYIVDPEDSFKFISYNSRLDIEQQLQNFFERQIPLEEEFKMYSTRRIKSLSGITVEGDYPTAVKKSREEKISYVQNVKTNHDCVKKTVIKQVSFEPDLRNYYAALKERESFEMRLKEKASNK